MEPTVASQSLACNVNGLSQHIERTEGIVNAFLSNPWKVLWLKKKDPELVKAFSRISSRLVELRVYLELGAARNGPPPPVQAVASVLQRITGDLGRDAAWDAAEDLKIALLYAAPDEHLSSLLEQEGAKSAAQPGYCWTDFYPGGELKELREHRAAAVKNGEAPSARWREVVMDRLATLYQQRMDSWRHDRANTQLRTNYFIALTTMLGLVLGLTSVMTLWQGSPFHGSVDTLLLTAMAAGALGSVLGGVYTLRDAVMSIRQLSAFWPVLTAQPFVGATAAMLIFVVLTSGLTQVAGLDAKTFDWRHHTIFAFLAGFSEPFFLGVVKRVAGVTEEKKASPEASPSAKEATPAESPSARPVQQGPGQ